MSGFNSGNFFFDRLEGLTEVIVAMKGRERRFIRDPVIIGQVMEFLRNGHGLAAGAAVIVLNDNFNVREMCVDRGFEVAKTDGLQAHIGVVEIFDRRLDEQNSHFTMGYSLCDRHDGSGCIVRPTILMISENTASV